jgi:hypothetical protein
VKQVYEQFALLLGQGEQTALLFASGVTIQANVQSHGREYYGFVISTSVPIAMSVISLMVALVLMHFGGLI